MSKSINEVFLLHDTFFSVIVKGCKNFNIFGQNVINENLLVLNFPYEIFENYLTHLLGLINITHMCFLGPHMPWTDSSCPFTYM